MPGAARQTDTVTGTDTHIVMVPSPGGPVPTPVPMPFSGTIVQGTEATVLIDGLPAATTASVALNMPPHVPTGGPFQRPPSNQGRVMTGSATVLVGGQPAARVGDTVRTCNDPIDLPNGSITSGSAEVIVG